MRSLVGFVLMLALGVVGCSETADTGGAGGDGGSTGNCGWLGFGGGASFLAPGLYENPPDTQTGSQSEACFYVNSDCTALAASEECDIGADDAEAQFLEIEWTDGTNEQGEACAARIGVTPDLVPRVPVHGNGFAIMFTDTEGAEWSISGTFGSFADWGFVHARRTIGESYCEPTDIPGVAVAHRD
jgi:hypothetical protein